MYLDIADASPAKLEVPGTMKVSDDGTDPGHFHTVGVSMKGSLARCSSGEDCLYERWWTF